MSMNYDNVRVAHLTASPFYGGPERQMAGLASAMPLNVRSTFLCLMENGKAKPFVDELRRRGHPAVELKNNHPHLIACAREVVQKLKSLEADILLTHGYKADIIGLIAARMARIPLVCVSRGWTWATRKVRIYEAVDRLVLRLADHVVCVSEGQAAKVRKAGVRSSNITVIRNSVDVSRFSRIEPKAEQALRSLFPDPVMHVVLAVGRLSPEKGFDLLIDAATEVCRKQENVGFALIGDGPLRADLHSRIRTAGLQRRFVLAGFRHDVDALLPHASCLVQSSHTEGMPNVVLEAMAASVPVIATSVGGTPELMVDGQTGILVPPGNASAISEGILTLLGDSMERACMGSAGRQRVEEEFTFHAQARQYEQLLIALAEHRPTMASETVTVAQA